MRAGVMLEEHHKKILMEKQMGCMAGFFQIFDRHHLIATKSLPPPSGNASPSPSERSDASPPSPCPSMKLAEHAAPRQTLPLPVFDFQEGSRTSWKLKDSPRLSLDSRVLEGRGKLHPSEIHTSAAAVTSGGGSPSVVARLMGLDALPKLQDGAELRRSASESRASRDLLPYTFVQDFVKNHSEKPNDVAVVAKLRAPAAKSSFDARDFFPEKSKQRGSLYGEIEKKLRMRGIDEPAKDLENLKQILEALQLKGLLHSHQDSRVGHRNLIVEEHREASRFGFYTSPPTQCHPRAGRERTVTAVRTRKVRPVPDPAEAKSPSYAPPRRGVQKASSGKSPRSAGVGPRCARTDSKPSPRSRRAAAIVDLEKLKKMEEECSQGRSLLRRCDKLLHSIAAITERGDTVEPQPQQQPSPISVFDSSAAFYSDDAASAAASPSSVDSKDRAEESVEQHWMLSASPAKLLQPLEEAEAADCDFVYVANVLGSGQPGCFAQEYDMLVLPKKEREAAGLDLSCNLPRLHRRLVFDTVAEIVEKRKQISPWEAFCQSRSPCAPSKLALSARQVWEEVKRLREHVPANNHVDAVCGALKKDMAMAGSVCYRREKTTDMSGAVLDIERLIFKDLVSDTIRDLSVFMPSRKCPPSPAAVPRRKLVF